LNGAVAGIDDHQVRPDEIVELGDGGFDGLVNLLALDQNLVIRLQHVFQHHRIQAWWTAGLGRKSLWLSAHSS
jgi:hypothetical protein